MVSTKQGAAIGRPGSNYALNTYINGVSRLVPFIFSKVESFVIEISNNYFRVIRTSDNAVFIPTDATGFTGFFNAGHLLGIQFVQSGDTILLLHPDRIPIIISRTVSGFVRTTIDAIRTDGYHFKAFPFRDRNLTGVTLQSSGTFYGAATTLTANLATFSPGHVGSFFKLTIGGNTGVIKVLAYTSPTVVTGVVVSGLSSAAATDNWEEAAWSNFRGWPRSGTYFQGRLVLGGCYGQPDTVWGSKTGDYFHFMQKKFAQDGTSDTSTIRFFGPAVATDPVPFTLSSQQVNIIQWMSSGTTLGIGTIGSAYVGSNLSATDAPNFKADSSEGSAFVQCCRSSNAVYFVQRSGKNVFELVYDFNSDSFVADEVSVFADHMNQKMMGAPSPIMQIDQHDSRGILWCRTYDGGLFGMTRSRKLDVLGWHHMQLGGKVDFPGGEFPPNVISMAVLPSPNGAGDDLWLVVLRSINGQFQHTIEVIRQDYELNTLKNLEWDHIPIDPLFNGAPYFTDCSVARTLDPPSKTVTGLGHLIGETVSVLADGYDAGDYVVSPAGTIELAQNASGVVAGLKMVRRIKTLRTEGGSLLGSAQGAMKRIDRVDLRLFRTVGGKIGPSETKLAPIRYQVGNVDVTVPQTAFTGSLSVNLDSGYDRDGYVVIQQDRPLPFAITSLILRGDTNET